MNHESLEPIRAERTRAAARRARAPGASSPPSEPAAAIEGLRAAAIALERERRADVERCAPAFRDSARNLLHYLALRRHDLRPLQRSLARLGLSSLGRMEPHVMATLDAVAQALRALHGEGARAPTPDPRFDLGEALLDDHAFRIFGPKTPGRDTRIMVTLPTEAADDPELLHALLEHGTDLVRINAAHDDMGVWARMLGQLDHARTSTHRACRVSFDLAGPKLRTGPLEPGHAVLRLRPRRDALGRELGPATVRLVAAGRAPDPRRGVLPIDPRLLRRLHPDDVLELVDARGRTRRLRVTGRAPDGSPVCSADRSVYLVPGTPMALRRGKRVAGEGEVGPLPHRPGGILLRAGDRLDLVHGTATGHDRRPVLGTSPALPATVSCEVGEVFGALRPGHRVLFDDGLVAAVVRDAEPGRAVLEVVHCAGGSAVLHAEKGINLPDTALGLPALTARDREHLAFAARRVDLVSASFVRDPQDVDALREALAALGATRVAIVLKIETAAGFAALPELLLAALRHPGGVGVMVARGDLAVEVGFERLAEVQEEILWLCEAAHVPVIWATQVLDGLARDGVPTRAEVTDAAMGARAECVMLNKGPFVVEAVAFLSDVLSRMRSHHDKKRALLRALSVSRPLPPTGGAGSRRHAQA
jgi:pyruvate kinase